MGQVSFQELVSQTDAATHVEHPQPPKISDLLSKPVQQVGHFDFKKKLSREPCEAGGCLNFPLIGVGKAIKIHQRATALRVQWV